MPQFQKFNSYHAHRNYIPEARNQSSDLDSLFDGNPLPQYLSYTLQTLRNNFLFFFEFQSAAQLSENFHQLQAQFSWRGFWAWVVSRTTTYLSEVFRNLL